ncbi:hypothetical protein Tco_1182681 [Tanacetum coccineum]
MQQNELIDLVTKLSDRVQALETNLQQTKKVYSTAFTKLIMKVKRLKKIVKSSESRRRAKIVMLDDENVAEDPSKKGRSMIEEIDLDARISLVPPHVTKENFGDDQDFSTARPVSTAGAAVTTASASISNATPPLVSTAEDISTAETPVYIRRSASKDKGKSAVRLQEQLDEEERQSISRVHEEASSFNLVDLINQRKRHFAQQRAEERRNKLLTQAQQRTNMSNYIKHMGSHTLQQLKRLSFDELKNLFEATRRRVQNFIPMESDVDRTHPKIADESSKRTAEEELDQESSKRLYDACGVHHVSSVRGHDIFMLVEKDYPLSNGVLMLMLSNKLQVDQPSGMANELLRKIFILANRPRQ